MKRQSIYFKRVLFLVSAMGTFLFFGFVQAAEMGKSTINSSRMIESATTIMDGYTMMKSEMMKEGIMRADDELPGGKMMLDGKKTMIDSHDQMMMRNV